MCVRLKPATSATSLTLRNLTLNKNRNRVVTSATLLMDKDLGITFLGIGKARFSSSLIIKDLAGTTQLDLRSATVPVALSGVPPASDDASRRQLFGEAIKAAMVVGGTPTTAVETTALVCLAGAVNYRDERNPTGAMTPTVAEG